jgi:hypothetical protein
MSVISDSDLGSKYWCTSEQVRDRFELEVGNSDPDFETRIIEATDEVQAQWAEATGKSIPSELPATPPDLLQYAVAYKAASTAHLHFAVNIQSENDGDERHVFLNRKGDTMFERWKDQADLSPESESDGEASGSVTGESGVMGGSNRSPIQRGESYSGDWYGFD